ncbi:hypothetical protein AWR36_005750 [Microbulbifer flavimaris]|uniref:Sulfotransferase domain-containing protein n=1 Tax=Microbulbifer flavimaris TaxID=1781068 RepID=A0ABX4I0P3_9GAMM|nr:MULTISPECIES: hypothetical protein [Microbulbifer]KUJ83367.1 hypothetical protein AVO43_05740 [Microbulbifer sp. ZGT114]PCO05522.1 hypothetical protein AWR36_005750 [Microbulbifer flavimaris]
MTTTTLENLLYSPNYLLQKIDITKDVYIFQHVSAKSYKNSAFLDMRIKDGLNEYFEVPRSSLDKILDSGAYRRKTPKYIFHPSFTGSTFASRALHSPGVSLGIREPWILREVADIKRQLIFSNNFSESDWRPFIRRIAALVGKSYLQDEVPVIKPSNVSNNLIGDLLSLDDDTRGVYLYTDLDTYICANINKPQETKGTIPTLATVFGRDLNREPWMTSTHFYELSHIKTVVALWHIQHQQLLRLLRDFGDKLLPVYSEDLFSHPESTLMRIDSFLSLGIPEDKINSIRLSPVYQSDSKNAQRAYNPALRSERYQAILEEHRAEIAEAKEWFDQLSGEKGAEQTIISALKALPS